MIRSEPSQDPPHAYECFDCGYRELAERQPVECAECGGAMKNVSKPQH